MKNLSGLLGLMLILLVSCTKQSEEIQAPPPNNSSTPTATSAAILTDPVNCPSTSYASNSHAFQITYARMKLLKGMTGQLKNITPAITANSVFHVYLRAQDGKYYHLPGNSSANIAYNYGVKSTFPQSTLTLTRGTGVEEVFETIIVLGIDVEYASSLSSGMDYNNYLTTKTKLGF